MTSDGPTGPLQRIARCSTRLTAWRDVGLEPLGGVDRAEHLLEGGAVVLELEADGLAVAEQAVRAAGEAVTIDLVAVAQAGLHDARAPVDLVDEAVEVGQEVGVDAAEVGGDDRAEQQPAEAGRRVGRAARGDRARPAGSA